MSDKKKSGGRYKYFQDYPFEDVPKKNGKGTRRKRVYRGKYFAYAIPKEYKKDPRTFVNRIKLFYGLAVLAMIILWVAGSFMNPEGSKAIYVVVPYMVAAFAVALMAFTVGELALFTPEMKYKRDFADALGSSLRIKTIIAMISAAITCVSEITYVIINYQNLHDLVTELGFAVLMVGIAALSIFMIKLEDSLKLEEKSN